MSYLRKGLGRLNKYHGRVSTVALGLLSFLIPIYPQVLPILSVLGMVSLFIHYGFPVKPRRVLVFRNPVLVLSALFYLVHVVGLLWSSNWDFALLDLQIKLVLLVFPLAFFSIRSKLVGKKALLLMFVLGCCYAVVLNISMAFVRVLMEGGVWHRQFISSEFSPLIHPSYFALYLTVALAVWYFEDIHGRYSRLVRWLVPIVLLLGILLSGSKAGWLIALFMLPCMLFFFHRNRSIRVVLGGLCVLMALGATSIYSGSEYVRYRVDELLSTVLGSGPAETDPTDSSKVRTAIWSASGELFREQPLLGAGTGDVKDVLVAEYAERGMFSAVEKRLNAHSQFVQSAVALGLLGICSLLALVFFTLYHSWRNKKYSLVAFMLIMAANLSVESMLEVQAGVLFFTWMAFLFSMED